MCPGFVNTNIMDAERNRPEEYLNDLSKVKAPPGSDKMEKVFREIIKTGMSPTSLADIVFQAIINEKFYTFTHPEFKDMIQMRMDAILNERNPCVLPMEKP